MGQVTFSFALWPLYPESGRASRPENEANWCGVVALCKVGQRDWRCSSWRVLAGTRPFAFLPQTRLRRTCTCNCLVQCQGAKAPLGWSLGPPSPPPYPATCCTYQCCQKKVTNAVLLGVQSKQRIRKGAERSDWEAYLGTLRLPRFLSYRNFGTCLPTPCPLCFMYRPFRPGARPVSTYVLCA